MKCDDICFTHILPRLNSNDLKFLYEVNSETRALVKRSSRAGDLKEKFRVGEMSSISTLEVAWENKSLWRSYWDETYFCNRVACTNKFGIGELPLLRLNMVNFTYSNILSIVNSHSIPMPTHVPLQPEAAT